MGSVVSGINKAISGQAGADQKAQSSYARGQQGATNTANAGAVSTGEDRIAQLLAPYLNAGTGALGDLTSTAEKGFTAGDFQADPGYQFALQQGLQSTQNAAGVQGSPFGGAAMMAMQQYSTGLANQTYQNAFNRWNTQVGNLQNIAGLGAGVGTAEGGNITSLINSLVGGNTSTFGSAIQGNTNAASTLFGAL